MAASPLVSEARAVDLIRVTGTGTVMTLLSLPSGERDMGLLDAAYDWFPARFSPTHQRAKDTTSAAVTLRSAASHIGVLSAAESTCLPSG